MRKRELNSVAFLVLFLLPLFVQAFSIESDLGAGEFYSAYREASTGWRIEGSFSVNNDIEFFICDEVNYTRWKRHESTIFYEHREETMGQIFNFTIPYNSTWHVVFSNVQSQVIISLEAELYYIDELDIIQTQVSWVIQNTFLNPLFIGFLLVVPIVCLLGVWISRRGEQTPSVRYDDILPHPN